MLKQDWRLSVATANDIEVCIAIRGKTRENSISATRLAELGITLQSWQHQVTSGQLSGVIANVDTTAVGYCFGDNQSGEIVVLALLPEFEGRGIGKALLNDVVGKLFKSGHKRLFLGCDSRPHSRSHGFYRHLGWRSTGTIDRYGDEVLELTL